MLQYILKIAIFINSKVKITIYQDTIYSQLRAYRYSKVVAKATIQIYYSLLAKNNKIQIYREFTKSNSRIQILIYLDTIAQGVDIIDITYIVVYYILRDYLISLLQQKFSRAAYRLGVKGQVILLLKAQAKGLRSTIGTQGVVNACDLLQQIVVTSAWQSCVKQPSQLSQEYQPNN